MDFKESGFMYALGGFIVIFVLAQSLFFLIRAWKQGKKLGLSTATMRGTVTQSALFSLAPAISIVATILTLSGALGFCCLDPADSVGAFLRGAGSGVWPWRHWAIPRPVRGDHGSPGLFYRRVGDDSGLCDASCDHSLCHEENSKQYRQGGEQEYCLADVMSAAAFIGLISAFVGRAIVGQGDKAVLGDGAGIMSITALAVSMLSMLLFMQIEKKKKIAWLQSMAMPLAMFIGMGAVMLLAKVLPTHIAWLEWRG